MICLQIEVAGHVTSQYELCAIYNVIDRTPNGTSGEVDVPISPYEKGNTLLTDIANVLIGSVCCIIWIYIRNQDAKNFFFIFFIGLPIFSIN